MGEICSQLPRDHDFPLTGCRVRKEGEGWPKRGERWEGGVRHGCAYGMIDGGLTVGERIR